MGETLMQIMQPSLKSVKQTLIIIGTGVAIAGLALGLHALILVGKRSVADQRNRPVPRIYLENWAEDYYNDFRPANVETEGMGRERK
jgi:hypothetical protein